MLLKYFYDKALAHASYLVGCQRAKVAIVVDPGRDIQQYLEMADHEDLEIIGVAETHVHADYVSGARELAANVGAKLYVSDEGPAEWKYQFANEYSHQLLKDGDTFTAGNIRFEVLHTPGHTPESISFLLTDEGGGANEPMGIFTGDFVFVGSIGRPDLLEEAAGLADTAEPGARDLYHSAERFKQLPDYLQVWPAHGAGSACGKGLGAIPSSTVGYEKRFNPALQFTDKNEFVAYILDDQPEAPKYFAVMKRVNKEGPDLLGDAELPAKKSAADLASLGDDVTLIDLSAPKSFGAGHVPGSLNIPSSMLASWAGWLVDYDQPAYLLGKSNQLPEAMRVLRKIGMDKVQGFFDIDEIKEQGLANGSYRQASPRDLVNVIKSGDATMVDVRSDSEWVSGRAPFAKHLFLGRLEDSLDQLDREKPVVTQCQSGARSAIAASLLQAYGFDVINLVGGFSAWLEAGLPTEAGKSTNETCGVNACD